MSIPSSDISAGSGYIRAARRHAVELSDTDPESARLIFALCDRVQQAEAQVQVLRRPVRPDADGTVLLEFRTRDLPRFVPDIHVDAFEED